MSLQALRLHWRTVLLVLVVALMVVGTPFLFDSLGINGTRAASTIPLQAAARPNPLAGLRFYNDPNRPVVRAFQNAEQQGRKDEAQLLSRIALQPSATWVAGGNDDASEVQRVTAAAKTDHSTALLVAYNIPHRDACGGRSSGGAVDDALYHAWLDAITAAIQGPAVIIVEPDAVADLANHCLSGDQAYERAGLLSDAVQEFKAQPAVVAVYLDAGNPRWFPNPADLVATLHSAGVHFGDGISVNVANFVTTRESAAWAWHLTDLLSPGTPAYGAILDTSRNGSGPYQGDQDWCNPPGRALGNLPNTHTSQDAIDAWVWAKVPGDSDGTCRGGPPAGTFWLEYALGLVSHK